MKIQKILPTVQLSQVNKTTVDIHAPQGFVLPVFGRWKISLGIKIMLDTEELAMLIGKTSGMNKGIIIAPEIISDEKEVFVTFFNIGDLPTGITAGELVARVYSLRGSNNEIQISA